MKYSESYFSDLDKSWLSIPEKDGFNNKSILIAGATGLIGSAIADLVLRYNKRNNSNTKLFLAARSVARTINRFSYYEIGKDYEFCQYEAAKDESCKIKADYYVFAANNSDPISYAKDPVGIMLANLQGIKTLLDTAKENAGSRVLYISSSEVYGEEIDAPYREEKLGSLDILDSRSCYPSSKRCAETLCIAYKAQFGVDSVIARPGHIYGPMCTPTDSKASAQFARCALAGQNIVLKSTGAQKRSYCYALDCASAILTVLLKGESGEAYNIANKDSYATVRELANAFAKAVGKKVIFENPSDLEIIGFNKMLNSSLDSSKLEKLGWIGAFTIEQGVHRTLRDM